MKKELFVRNMGFYTEEDLKTIQKTRVLVCGVGGMGGVCAELLIRLGYIHMTIADFDHFELSNTNRQIHCSHKVLGQRKVDVLKEAFQDLNPEAQINIVPEGLTDANREELVRTHDVIVNGIDNIAFSIMLRREAFKQKKALVDAWFGPAVSSFVIHPDNPVDTETFMGYPTKHLNSAAEFTPEIKSQCLNLDIRYTRNMMNTENIISDEIVQDVANHKYQKQFPVMVWLCGCLMANEIFKITLNKGAPSPLSGLFLNYINYNMNR